MTPHSILVVEDEVIVSADLTSKLTKMGYEVVGATGYGEEALELARQHRPSLVLMDVRLAGALDGIEAAVAIHRELMLPVVFLTAHSDAATIERAAHAEPFGYILKPFNDRELRTHIEMALYKYATEQRLREADRRKTEFIALLSHELRNPLAAIHTSLSVMDLVPAGSDMAQRSRGIIDRQVKQLTRLVDDLLDVTRITQNKIQIERQKLDLNALVRRALEDHRPLLDSAALRLLTQLGAQPVPVSGDAARLSQVVGNLLHNATKFTPPGGTITVSVDAEVADGQAVLRVADTGAGIEPELLDTMFQPFVQADKTLAHSKGGLGLGLSVVRGLVELHGGQVSALSAGPGRGAEFVVRLPLDEGQISAVPAARLRSKLVRRRVLIIEDNSDVAEALRQCLELDGHEVEVAYTGKEGLDKAQRRCPDIVLCDLGLPGLNGYELARRLRADKALGATYLVAISGYAQQEDVAAALAAGFDEHLPKPLSTARLTDLLAGAGLPAVP